VRLSVPVISVGNLEAGGTGKTPVVLALCRAALAAGFQPAVLTRAYRARSPRGVLRGGHIRGQAATAVEVGDEPLLLSRSIPEAPILLGKDRANSARIWLEEGKAVDLFVLDDGFQHRRLARDANVVLLDATRPLGNGYLLPAGPLRERPDALRRATHIVFTGNPAPSPEALEVAATYAPGARVLRAWSEPGELRGLDAGPAPEPRGLRVHGVCGIARPDRFRDALRAAGAEVAGWSAYPDHHRFRKAEVRREENLARARGAVPVTTTKDAVRLEGRTGVPWFVLESRLEVEGGWDAFLGSALGEG